MLLAAAWPRTRICLISRRNTATRPGAGTSGFAVALTAQTSMKRKARARKASIMYGRSNSKLIFNGCLVNGISRLSTF